MIYDNSQEIDPERVGLRGGFLLKTLVLSIDPFLRGQMRDKSVPSYSASISSPNLVSFKLRHDTLKSPFTLGEPYVINLGTRRGPI